MRISPNSGSLIWPCQRSSAPARVTPCTIAMLRKPWNSAARVDDPDRPRSLDPAALVTIACQHSRFLSNVCCALRFSRLRLCDQRRDFFAKPKTGNAQEQSSPRGFDNGSLALLALRNPSRTSHSLQMKKRLLPSADTPFFHLLASPARIPVQHRNLN